MPFLGLDGTKQNLASTENQIAIGIWDVLTAANSHNMEVCGTTLSTEDAHIFKIYIYIYIFSMSVFVFLFVVAMFK